MITLIMKRGQALLATALCGVLLTTSLGAQQHVLDRAALDALVTARVADDEARRASIRRVLAHPEVAHVAQRVGLDLDRVIEGVATLEGEELAEVTARTQAVDTALSGGQSTITLTTTTIILVLLVAILVIVAVD